MGVGIGDRLYTITAWENEEAERQVMQQAIHKQAVTRFFCPECATVIDAGTQAGCRCGHQFTSRPLF